MSINEVRYLPECGSTNAYVKEHFEEFGPVAAVYTENQTAGRGRRGRRGNPPPRSCIFWTMVMKRRVDGFDPRARGGEAFELWVVVENARGGGGGRAGCGP